jgi:sugar/nucleoside kinase (ribokinase family)
MNVFILGELNVDLIITGSDVTPEWNREKIVESFDTVLGSSSAITACGLAGLGMNVYFVSVVGDDSYGKFCIEKLHEMGIDTTYVHMDPALKTGVTLSLSTKKDRALLTYMGAIPQLKPALLPDKLFEKASHIHFGSYFLQKGMQSHWKKLFREAKTHGISTSFDTGWDPEEVWNTDEIVQLVEYTDLFIPSEDEFNQIFATSHLEQAKQKLPTARGTIAVKCGSKGALIFDGKSNQLNVPAFDILPIDTTGAGDSFNAGLIYGFLNGKKETELLEFANACGAMATQRIGGATHVPTFEEVESFRRIHALRLND